MDDTRTSPPRSGDVVSGDDFVSLPAGYPLARYQLIETLGQGTFGITYRAHDAQLDRAVAVKEYLPAALAVRHGGTQVLPRSTRLADDFRWGRERFLAEAQTLARFENAPAIVRVYDFLEANGTAYMVMELLRGETLEARLKRDGRLSPEVTEQLLKPLLDGLESVHGAGILHRDIKPSNITLDAEGQPTLLDFGAARSAVAGRTQAMTAVYTPGYAAAEQFTSTTQGPYTDIYALSATLYQCVTGTMPPTAMERLLDDRLVPASQAAAGRYSPRLLAGIDAGLALKAQDRPATIAAWRPMLLDGPPTVVAPVLPSAPPPRETRTRVSRPVAPAQPSRPGALRRWAIAGAVLLLVAGVAGGGYVYVRDAQERAEAERLAAEARQRELEAQRQAEARRQAEEQARRQAEEQARRQAEEQARREAEEQARRDAELAQRRAEEEAKRQAQLEQEAAQRQQEDARRQAEAARQQQAAEEARRRAAEEARRNAEAEARRQQDEEARRRAAEEARRKADADGQARRQQQEEEARRRAAEEARRKAEADARRQQEEAARRPQGGVDGTWTGVVECYPGGPKGAVTMPVAAGQGRATVQGMKITMRISESSVVSDLEWIGQEGREWAASLRGRPAGDSLAITGTARTLGGRPEIFRPQCTLNLRRQ
ncbi:MAG TPA: serine/threonine-protein kinase [Vineibacter sp.]|nr:serine/threonine-protein kinase [Vineibacter sp.]